MEEGHAGIEYSDHDGKRRILVSTNPDGHASVNHWDREENTRVGTFTGSDGSAGLALFNTTKEMLWEKTSE